MTFLDVVELKITSGEDIKPYYRCSWKWFLWKWVGGSSLYTWWLPSKPNRAFSDLESAVFLCGPHSDLGTKGPVLETALGSSVCEPEVTHAHVLLVGISQPHIVRELLSIVPHLVRMRHHPTMLFCRTRSVSKFRNRWMRNSWPREFVARGMAATCSLLLPNPVRPELKTQGETRFFFWIYYDTF